MCPGIWRSFIHFRVMGLDWEPQPSCHAEYMAVDKKQAAKITINCPSISGNHLRSKHPFLGASWHLFGGTSC